MQQTPEMVQLIKKFIAYAVKEFGIESNANITLMFEHDPKHPSAGGYMPFDKTIVVAAKNRAIADIMRTLAHELCHHRQNELGMITAKDGDNQDLEDEANIWSGRLVRWFGRKNKAIYSDLE